MKNNYDPKIKSFKGQDPYFYAERRLAQKSARLVDALKDLNGVQLEIVRYCLYVSGNTFPHKDALLDLGFKWDYKKRKWYHSMTFTRAN